MRGSCCSMAKVLLTAAVVFGFNGCRAESWNLWDNYASSFVDEGGRVVDPQGGGRTTSEGQAYGLFFALVANDRAHFRKLLDWTQDNLAGGDLTAHLPSWSWGKAADGQWKIQDTNSASDADLWMSYTLIEAGRLWREPRYLAIGKVMAARIAKEEVTDLPGLGPMLLPGPTGFHPDENTWMLNPSYIPLPLLERLSHLDPSGPWAGLSRTLPRFLAESAQAGFAMDWISYSPQSGFTPAPAPGRPADSPKLGSYDAIRVYLWAGMTDKLTPGSKAALGAVFGMASYLGTHLFPPEEVNSGGQIVSTNGSVGFSAAVIPYLDTLGMNTALRQQEARLIAETDPSTKLYGHPPTYYDQNLAMFAKGWAEHRFRFDRDGELRVTWKKP
jgi:endo-1,4-beta-D-glucanase Y